MPVGADASDADASDASGATDSAAEAAPEAGEPNPAIGPDGMCISGAYRFQGVCGCPPTTPDVCGGVVCPLLDSHGQCVSGPFPGCVDLQTDDDHCGTCSTTCGPTSACVAGVCGPAWTTFVAAPFAACGPMALATSEDTLYWTNTMNGTVSSIPAAGGPQTAISGAETTSPTLLFATGKTVFWVDGKTIRRSVNGVVSDVIESADEVRGITATNDAATVFFSSGSKILSVPATGGATTDIVLQDSGGLPAALSLQGGLVAFLIDILGGIDIAQISAVPAHCWTQDPSMPGTESPALDVNCDRLGYGLIADVVLTTPTALFWISNGLILTNELSAHAPQQIENVTEDTGASTMTMSNGEIFFLDTGQVEKVPALADSTPTRLARGIYEPTSIAVAGKSVFWTTGDCQIQTTGSGD
jgi:hypothetical protein